MLLIYRTIAFLSAITVSHIATAGNMVHERVEYSQKAMDILVTNGKDKLFKMSRPMDDDALTRYRNGVPLTDDYLTIRYSDQDDWQKHTYAGNNAPAIVKKFKDFKNNQLDYFKKKPLTDLEILDWKIESDGCIGELNTSTNPKHDSRISKCFDWLDKTKILAYPETSSKNTYLRGLSTVSSIVNKSDEHQCMASVYKIGIWVTARHCLTIKDDHLKTPSERMYLIISGSRMEIKKSSIKTCDDNNKCDIAFIKMNTGRVTSDEAPLLTYKKDFLDRDTKILMPGLAVKEYLSGKFEPAIYRQELLWSPYGKGFCRSMQVESNGCLIHTCSALVGFSGAPLYAYNETSGKLVLIGVHSGTDPEKNACEDKSGASYARTLAKGMDI